MTIEGLDDEPRAPEKRSRVVLAVLAVGVLLGLAAFTGGLFTPDPPLTPAPAVVVPGALGAWLRQGDFGVAVGGSLATDRAAVDQLRRRFGELFTLAPDQVILLWAGDLGGHRYAFALVPQKPGAYTPVVLSGQPGGELYTAWQGESAGDGLPTSPLGVFVRPSAEPGTAVVLVAAPRAAHAEIARDRRILPGGRMITTWRPLPRRSGAVFADLVRLDEQYLATYRLAGDPKELRGDSVGGADGRTSALDIASGRAARTEDGQRAVTCSADAARSAGASLAEQPAFVSATPWGRGTVAATLLRSPDGGWLWGICEEAKNESYASLGTDGTWGDAREAMFGAETAPGRFVVVTPQGAVRVRSSGRTSPVRDRLSVISVPGRAVVTIEALDRAGRVVGRTSMMVR